MNAAPARAHTEQFAAKWSQPFDLTQLSDANAANQHWLGQDIEQELLRLRHILQVIPTGIVVLDARGFVAQANPVALDMLGEPLLQQRWIDVIARSFRPRSDDGMEVSLHDGRRVQLQLSALEPLPGQLIVMTDLTETRELQARVAQLQRLSALGKMMASLAHQIRTPLSGAMLYAQNLQNQKLPAPARGQFCHKLLNRLQDLEQQVNDLLLFARAGREQQVSALSIAALFADVENAVDPLLQQHHCQLSVSEVDNDVCVLGNQMALAGALGNLVQNALQHSPAHSRIQLSAKRDERDGYVTLVVEDDGAGVPEHLRQQIFEPFFTTRTSGTGLGLAVVQAVVTSHQGAVRCTASPSGGARFEIRLPIIVASAALQSSKEC